MTRPIVARLAGLILMALADTPSAGEMRIDGAWARATPGALQSGAAYLTITSRGPAPHRNQ